MSLKKGILRHLGREVSTIVVVVAVSDQRNLRASIYVRHVIINRSVDDSSRL